MSDAALSQAVSAAQRDEPVVLKTTVPDEVSAVSLKLTAGNLQAIADNGGGMTLESPVAKVTLDSRALELVQGSGEDAAISVRQAEREDLPKKAADAVGAAPVYDLTITSGGENVSDFGKGQIQVAVPYQPKVNNYSDLLVCRVEDDGTLIPVPKSALIGGEMVFRVNHLSTYALMENTVRFQDTEGHWARQDVAFNAARGIVVGVGSGCFQPNAPVTVAATVTILGRLDGVEDGPEGTDWAAPHLAWARETGILPEGLVPDAPITRQQLAYVLDRYMGGEGEGAAVSYVDLDLVDPKYLSSIKRMRQAGIMHGRDDNSFDPTGNLTRAELAAVIHRMILLELQ